MYTVYKVLSVKNEENKWYEIYDIPIGIPVPPDCVLTPIPADLKNPKYDFKTDRWVEDLEATVATLQSENDALNKVVGSLQQEKENLKKQVAMNELALMDAISMLSSMIVEQ